MGYVHHDAWGPAGSVCELKKNNGVDGKKSHGPAATRNKSRESRKITE